jgi:hypothetical protein
VALITGNGLKDVQSARAAAGQPYEIAPDGAELEEILGGAGFSLPIRAKLGRSR